MEGAAQHRGWSLRRRMAVWGAGSLGGAAVVALPDDDARVFSLSAAHGPSPVDAVGIGVMVAAWLPVVALLWRSRGTLRGSRRLAVAALAGAGLAVLVTSVVGDTGAEWVLGAALLLGAQLVALDGARRGAIA